MRKQLLLIFLVSSVSLAQMAQSPQSNPAPVNASAVPATAPVITLHGLCPDKPEGTDPRSSACETVVTRAEFEHLANTLSPNMPATAKQSLATDYARMLVLSSQARKRGLEDSQHYKDLVNFLKMQLLAQELFRSYQDKAKPTLAEAEKYYQDNASKYEELSVKRLFIPRNRPPQSSAQEKPDTSATAPKPLTDAELQAEGEKVRAQLMAGGDFEKLEQEIYGAAGFKTPPPPTTIPNWRPDVIPPSDKEVLELKPKEFSKVIVEPSGAYIYQLVDKKQTPFSDVKPQIESTLTQERMRQFMDGIMANVKPEVNQAYFRSMGAEPTPPQATPSAAPMPASKAAVPAVPKPK
jgi:hypothetical protein